MRGNFGRRIAQNALLVYLMLSLSGCVYLIVGGVGVLGGYIVSPDTVEGILVDKSQDQVMDAAVEIVSVMGIISERSDKSGILIARVNGAKVTMTITAISQSAVKLNIKARKGVFPKIKLSQDIYTKVVTKVNQ